MEDLLTTQEVADWLRVSVHSVARWARSGELPALKVGPKGQHRFRRADVEAFANRTPEPTEQAS